MERNEYLRRCQIASLHDKKNIPEDILVVYDGIRYIPRWYTLGFENGATKHYATLEDVKAFAVCTAPLSGLTD